MKSLLLSFVAIVSLSAYANDPMSSTEPQQTQSAPLPWARKSTPEPEKTKVPEKASKPSEKTSKAPEATAGNRREVKGINDWSGYIEGKPAPKSRFSKIQIGMSQKQVTDLAGPPTDQGGHVTGKAFIPFYHGSGKYELVLYYKGSGRLRFAGNAGYSSGTGLVGIEHDANEQGYQR